MFDQLESVVGRYEEVNEMLSDPEVISDTKRFMKLSKEEGNLRETVTTYLKYKEIQQGIEETEEMLREKLDAEMAEMAKEELASLKAEREEYE